MKIRRSALVCFALALSACTNVDFGDAAFDAAYVMSQASDLKRCRSAYQETGDRYRFSECETSAVGD